MHAERVKLQHSNVNLGLELACYHARYGAPMPHRVIAAFCECRVNAICEIESNALKRMRLTARKITLTK
jgi:hypothetical protein